MRYGYDDADLDDVIRILKLPALNRQAPADGEHRDPQEAPWQSARCSHQ